MNRILYISLSVILFISCGNKDREILVKLMQEWKGREILYPNDMHFFMQGRDTLNADSICMYKIITYIDSIGCMSCKLGLSQWQDFAVNVDSIFPNTVHFQFVFQPYKLNEIRLLLKRERFNHSVYIDKNNKFNKLNKFPSATESWIVPVAPATLTLSDWVGLANPLETEYSNASFMAVLLLAM